MKSIVTIKKLLIAAMTILSVGPAYVGLPYVQQFSLENKAFVLTSNAYTVLGEEPIRINSLGECVNDGPGGNGYGG